MLGSILVSIAILSAPIATFADQGQCQLHTVWQKDELSVQYSVKQARSNKQAWVWTKYSDAWRSTFFNDKGVGKVKIYETKGDANFFIVICDSIVDGKCYVEE